MEIQDEIDRAIASGCARFEVSDRTNKLILSVEEGSILTASLDKLGIPGTLYLISSMCEKSGTAKIRDRFIFLGTHGKLLP